MTVTRRGLLATTVECVLAGRVMAAQAGKKHDDINQLPKNLPVPVDDGACKHLPGLAVPPIALRSTGNRSVNLAEIASPRTVVYCYPRTGPPGQEPPPGWNEIPGARGCTPESCGFRDHHRELQSLHAEVFGLSSQTTEYQQEMVARLHLPFEVLSDANFAFTDALRLPTWQFDGVRLLKRLTLVISGGKIEKVFYPVFPPDQHAKEVVDWLQRRAARAGDAVHRGRGDTGTRRHGDAATRGGLTADHAITSESEIGCCNHQSTCVGRGGPERGERHGG